MVCVHCGSKTRVANSRPQHKSNQVWRRRQCIKCGAVFTTVESVQHELTWLVKHSKRLEPFQRDKLLMSLYKSCEHRQTALNDARGLTETIIGKLRDRVSGGALEASEIAQTAQVALNRFDKAASVHYRAFHQN